MEQEPKQIVLIGAGIMSATFGILIKTLLPEAAITIYERLDGLALESSDAMNNAGTGHAAFCELNYTPENEDCSIDIRKAVKICSSFEMSKAFWSYLIGEKYFDQPETFIHNIPHISFVWGDDNVAFLKKRFAALQQNPMFAEMEFSEDWNTVYNWMPLVMQCRDPKIKFAATRIKIGTDINFGALTRNVFKHLLSLPGVELHLQHEVRDLNKESDGLWEIEIKNLVSDEVLEQLADFVFVGAGGGSLPLLDNSKMKEMDGYGGFPVSGQWLVCKNETVIQKHHAKVYGKSGIGAPPMSVPHLDTRIIDGKKQLLFGPFAGFSTKFLKNGSFFDLPLSMDIDNIIPMLSAGWHNMRLTKYLIEQVRMSHTERMDALREYFPEANDEEWELEQAGQRVQVIKKDKEKGGVLEFGTEIITNEDGTCAGLLGASPGASTAVYIMVQILKKCFPELMNSTAWKKNLLKIIPMLETPVDANFDQWLAWRKKSNQVLHLDD